MASTLHNRIVPSSLPDAKIVPAVFQARHNTRREWPRR